MNTKGNIQFRISPEEGMTEYHGGEDKRPATLSFRHRQGNPIREKYCVTILRRSLPPHLAMKGGYCERSELSATSAIHSTLLDTHTPGTGSVA